MPKSFDKKLEQLRLQHKIFTLLYDDNGVSSHFDYHVNMISEEETIKLNLLTYNQSHNEYMLFHTVKGSSSIDCLRKMLRYIEEHKKHPKKQSFTIKWKKKSEAQYHQSYFSAISEAQAIKKFLHEKDENEYEYECYLNPVS